MRLQRLTGLERDKILAEYAEVGAADRAYRQILATSARSRRSSSRSWRDPREVRRRAPHADRRRGRRDLDRGPDRRRGHGRHHLPRGLHQAEPGEPLPRPAARRPGQDRRRRRATRTSSSICSSPPPTVPPVLHHHGEGLLAEGARVPQAGRAARGRSDRQPAAASSPRRSCRHSCRCASSRRAAISSSPRAAGS